MKLSIKILLFALFCSFILFITCDPAAVEELTKATTENGLFLEKFQYGVFPAGNYTDTKDTFLVSTAAYANYNYGASVTGSVGCSNNTVTDIYRYLLMFNISGHIPKGAIIEQAYLILYIDPSRTESLSLKGIYEVIRDYTEGVNTGSYSSVSATWLTYDGISTWTNAGGDFNAPLISNSLELEFMGYEGYYTFSINRTVVQKWIDTPENNFGMIIKNINENPPITNNSYSLIYSNNNAALSRRPMLEVYYRLP